VHVSGVIYTYTYINLHIYVYMYMYVHATHCSHHMRDTSILTPYICPSRHARGVCRRSGGRKEGGGGGGAKVWVGGECLGGRAGVG